MKRFAAILGILLLVAGQASALTQSDFTSLFQHTPFYDPTCQPSDASASTTSTPAPSGSLVWPFETKNSSQYDRVDQGWDIQDKPGANIYAIAPGTLHVYAPDPGMFGNDYPTEELDYSIGGPSKTIYYGHVHIIPSLKGQHVVAGQLIAHANQYDGQGGSGAPPGWLEIGFARPGTDAPVASTIPSPEGQKIKDLLIDTQPGSGGPATPSSAPAGGSSCTCTAGGTDNLAGNNNEEKSWNYFKSKGLTDQQTAGVMGNLADETGSTFDPQIVEGGGRSKTQPKTGGADGWGIVQWTYPYQEVDKLFDQYKDKYNLSGNLYELKTQLDIVWAQMNETSPTGVTHMIGQLKNINDVAQAATYFSDNFEGGVPGTRVADALSIYAKYKGQASPSGAAASPGAATPTSDTLNGHKLPATIGGTGYESFFPSYALGKPSSTAENNYYITMRWRYSKWNWDGTSVPGPEDIGFYQKHPRVLVTNPRTHKSIIAAALESGPAPWTGTQEGPSNKPAYWHDPQDGTPSEYDGRVSGFPPPAIRALGASQWMNGASGDKLEYAWAPDQNATPGPTDLSVDNTGSGSSCDTAGTTGTGSNSDIVQTAKQELALGLEGTGPLQDGGPVCKYQGSGCPQPWCADFVSWVYKAAGKPFSGGADGGWRLAVASDTTGYFLSRKSNPGVGYGTSDGGDKMEVGWVVSFKGEPSRNNARGIGHVGIVVTVNGDGTFDYIDGNGAGAGVSLNKHIPISDAVDWGGYK